MQNQLPPTHTQAEPAPTPYLHCPNTEPQLALGVGLLAGQPAGKHAHAPPVQLHWLPSGYGQRRFPMHALVAVGSLAGQALPLPVQRQTKLFPACWHEQLRPV